MLLQDPFVQLLSGYLQQKMVTSRGAEVCIYMTQVERWREGGREGGKGVGKEEEEGREGGREGEREREGEGERKGEKPVLSNCIVSCMTEAELGYFSPM